MDENAKPTNAAALTPLSRNHWIAIFFVSLVATLTFITIPRYPHLIDDALSEKAVLSYANQHGFQFGQDIVFTYGPLGFLVSRYFFAHAAGIRMAIDFATCFATALGLTLLAWRLGTIWKWLLLALFVFLTSNIDPRADLVLYIGLLCWGMLCFLETGHALAVSASVFIGLAVFSVLVKANFLVLAGTTSALIVLDLVVRGNPRAAIGMVFGLICAFLLGWLAAGQSVSNLKLFFLNSIPIILDYDKTVGLEGLPALQQRGWITLPLISATAMIQALAAFSGADKRVRLRRALLFIWLATLLFIIWKHSFVRAGLFHGGFYFGLIPILALALEALPSERIKATNWARALGGLCCLICFLTLQSFFFSSLISSLLQPFRVIPANLLALVRPREYARQMIDQQKIQLAETRLPQVRKIVGAASVDVFGQDQAYAVFNDLNYRSRPIFQSYMAYNTALTRMNEQFYLSKDAPEFVLFKLAPVDRRYGPLEDGAVLRHLLINYEPIIGENQFLLLKSRHNSSPPKLTLLREGTVAPGGPIPLNQFGQTDLWLQVTVNPTFLGRARQFFYKPTVVRLAMWRKSSRQGASTFRAPTPMLAAGFIVSPTLVNTEDTLNLYTDSSVSRPYACSVELGDGNDQFWQEAIHYRIYKIENKIGRRSHENLPRLLTYAGFQAIPTEIVSSSNALIRVESEPAFFLPISGYIRLNAPKGAKSLAGKYGISMGSVNSQPANFRIEEEMPDGTTHILHSHVANPGDHGMEQFSVPLSVDAEHKLILRTGATRDAQQDGASNSETQKALPITCWADVRFN